MSAGTINSEEDFAEFNIFDEATIAGISNRSINFEEINAVINLSVRSDREGTGSINLSAGRLFENQSPLINVEATNVPNNTAINSEYEIVDSINNDSPGIRYNVDESTMTQPSSPAGTETDFNQENSTGEISSTASTDNRNKQFELNLLNANARSLSKKIGSLIDMFDCYEVTIATLTETWFKDGKQLEAELLDLNYGEDITLLSRCRNGRGGGVAIAFNSALINMKEFKLPDNKYEMVCAVCNTAHSNRKIAVISVYIPPRQRVATTNKLKECLALPAMTIPLY